MSKKDKDNNKIIKYPKSTHFSIGFVIIGVMFIYMVYHVFTYITRDTTTIYEVSQGSIASNLEYNALAIRDETIYYSDLSGKILYLAENLGRVGVKSDLYAIDETGDLITSLSATSLSDENIDSSELSDLQSTISSFTLDYSDYNFSKVYTFKQELASQINQIYNLSAMNSLEGDVDSAVAAGTFHIYTAPKEGLVSYTIDGYEDLTLDSFTSENFITTSVTETNLKSQESVTSGQPIYKLINSDIWYLVCQLDESTYTSLQENNYLEIEFLEDEKSTWTSCSFEERGGAYYLILKLDDSVVRYANSRFVHIKILDQDINGLKIPNSSIVTKDFFTIPKSYFYQQGTNTDDLGIMVQDGTDTKLVTPTIYYETEDYYYVDDEKVSSGDILIKANSSDKYIVGSEISALEGVYNVNKGYAVFKQIEVIYQNEDYSIIKVGTDYGIAMYDHIVLQGDEVEEDTIIN